MPMTSFSGRATPYALVFCFALILRFGWITLGPLLAPSFANPLRGDAVDYDALAQSLVAGQGFAIGGEPTAFRAPGYPFFLALVYWTFGHNILIVQIVQALMSALAVMLTMYLGELVGGRRIALLSGIGAAGYHYFFYVSAWLISETLFLFLWLVGLVLLIRFIQRGQSFPLLWSGIAFGLATLTRPATLLAVLLWSGVGWIALGRRRVWGILLLATLLTILPWTIRNWFVFDTFIPISTNSGYVFYGANNSDAMGGQREGFPPWLPNLSEPERDREYIRRAFDWITAHPADFVWLLPKKLARLWSPLSISSADRPMETRFDGLIYPLWVTFLALALWGCALTFQREAETAALLTVPLIATNLTALIFFGSTRYAVPMVPSLLIFAAFATDALIQRALEHIRRT
jgi:4-amino-4-deoxy-L-arabinose transferase-like glycosyltransferase